MLRVNQVWNFGQAGLMAIAFYTMFVCMRWLDAPLPIGIAMGLAATVAAAMALERWGFRVLRQRKSNTLTYFIFTITFPISSFTWLSLFLAPSPNPWLSRSSRQ